MKTMMMSLVLVIATACTTVGTTSTVAKDDAGQSEEGLRKERQQALLEALEGKKAQ